MLVFVFKQKTAYEMRISDWSSDVCSSDLAIAVAAGAGWGSGAGRTHETSSGSNDPPGVSPCTSNSDEGVLLQKRHARDILGRLAPPLIASTPSPLSSVLKPAFCRRVETSFGTSRRPVRKHGRRSGRE